MSISSQPCWVGAPGQAPVDASVSLTSNGYLVLVCDGVTRACEDSANCGQALYRVLSENATDVVVLTDTTPRITWVSPSALQEWGVDPQALVGKPSTTDILPDDLVRRAGPAMRQAKHLGPYRWEFARLQLCHEARRRLLGEQEARHGLRRDEFGPWCRPVTSSYDGRGTGFEALVRWIHQGGRADQPAEFLPTAEASTLITAVDAVVLSEALAQLVKLPPGLTMAVNVWLTTLRSDDYLPCVPKALEDSGADVHRLHLEITESVLLGAGGGVVKLLGILAEVGVRWYIDDFGTGYSSIAHLRDLPVSGIKLDKSFVAGFTTDPTRERLAHGPAVLGLDSVAEGVETQAQDDTLHGQGWRHGQGWLHGHPAPLPGLVDPDVVA